MFYDPYEEERERIIKALPRNTKHFKRHHVESLNIELVSDTRPIDTYAPIPEWLMLKGFDELDIQDYQYSNRLGVNAKSLVQLLKAVILLENYNCPPKYSETDAFVDFLLRSFGLDKYPSRIKLQYSIEFESDFKEIESTCGFMIQNPDIAQVLVVETDKHLNVTSKADMNGQYQVIAEMIGAAQEAFLLHRSEILVHGVKVVGTVFTFYEAFFSKNYMHELLRTAPSSSVHLFIKGLAQDFDFTDPGEREQILAMFSKYKYIFTR